MIYTIQILLTLSIGVLLLTLASDAFAYRVSRVMEALLDRIEYKLALRAQQQGRTTRAQSVSVAYETS